MKSVTFSLFILSWIMCVGVFAGELRDIELNDGSVVSGEIVSFKEGIYYVESVSLGSLQIDESKIRIISSQTATPTKGKTAYPSKNSLNRGIQNLQKSMISNADIINKIISLQDDPDIQEILQDPAIMDDIESGNLQGLLNSPKFMGLMDKSNLQEIMKQVPE